MEVKPESIKKGKSSAIILAAEGDCITKKLLPRDYLTALDRTGKAFASRGLAAWINELSFSHDRLAFVIGGPLGLSKEILKKTHETLSLSRLTLTHEMSRLVLLEQLYCAFTIINNEKYHK